MKSAKREAIDEQQDDKTDPARLALTPHSSLLTPQKELLRRGRRQVERTAAVNDYFDKALLALSEKRYEDAVAQFQAVLKVDADRADARYYLGLTRFMLGDYPAAANDMSAAIDNGYAEPDAHERLGDAYFLQEQYGDAVEAYRAAVHERASAEAYARMGQALQVLGRRDEAVQAFAEALRVKLT